jgi:phosphoribosyl 1,2-cyclic phosphodiesterase
MFHSLASSSSGNLYVVNDGETKVLLECGLVYTKLAALLGHHVLAHAACFISHEHSDHATAAWALAHRGMPIYCHPDTGRALGLVPAAEMLPGVTQCVGSLVVTAIEARHDVPCVGYIVYSKRTGEKLLFAIDTCYIPNKIGPGLTEVAVECNYSMELMRDDDTPPAVKRRIMGSHMAVETFLGFCQANDLGRVRKIWLLHMSNERGDAELFKRMVQEATGIPTEVAG